MRTVASLVLTVLCGCGAATGIPVGDLAVDASARDTSVPHDVVTPPLDAGSDASDADADALTPPPDADADSSGETVLCTSGGVASMPISETNCAAGMACIPEQGCVPSGPGLPPATACGVIDCATECGCLSGSVCNCANLP